MPRIKIFGAEYKAAFESAQWVIANGILSEEMPDCHTDDYGCIHNGNNVFEFVDDTGFQSRSHESNFRITEDGANWFSLVRDPLSSEASNLLASGSHLWEEFLSDLSRKYHDKFFLVACKRSVSNENEDASNSNEEMFEQYSLFAQNILTNFYPDITEWELSQVFGENNFDDIYGLSLRMQIGTGGEKEIPMLGTLYFKQYGKRKMLPLSADDAKRIEESLTDSQENDEYTAELNRDVSATINSLNVLFSEFSKTIAEDTSGAVLAECVYFSAEDERNLRGLLSRIQNDNKVVVCKQVEILGISHLNLEKYSFIISDKKSGRELFALTGGVDGKILMLCLGCGEEGGLILNNRVSVKDPKTQDVRVFLLDPSQEDLGLNEKDLHYVKENGPFASHFITVGAMCKTVRNGMHCQRLRCKNQLISLNTPMGECDFCQDCPYPEVIYQTNEGELLYTPTLRFNSETISLESSENSAAKVCMCCGRTVTQLQNDLYCTLCGTAMAPDAAAERIGTTNYKKYSTILPLGMRKGKTKLCFEDDELLLFVLGKKKYIYHKMWLDNTGRKPQPHIVTG